MRAVPNGDHPDHLIGVGEVVDDAIGAEAQDVEAAQPPTQGSTRARLPLEQGKGLLDRVDQSPLEGQQVAPRLSRQDQLRHGSAGRAPLGELLAELGESDRLTALDLAEARLDRGNRLRVGEDLGRFLERLVLVDREQAAAGAPFRVTTTWSR